ncbi:hypothetical protein CPLU01_01864 [Colletotrichum plurivorum]|uniref:Uncharacterized protein n=1 Tax=Colletotrichum plurivorum TaxID=2175906 RepID=A0A8H6KXF6_9PEZI|nr:hypothetical protein CPLU01_01864 [Colletotrichum plurivorum]
MHLLCIFSCHAKGPDGGMCHPTDTDVPPASQQQPDRGHGQQSAAETMDQSATRKYAGTAGTLNVGWDISSDTSG